MNYRHAFHAGNFADIWKHVLLLYLLTHLKQKKDKPFRVIDTHAGAGLYRLTSEAAQRTGEWRAGVGRLFPADVAHGESLPPVLASLRASVEAVSGPVAGADMPTVYPGSPVLAALHLRSGDTLIANETEPDVRKRLDASLAGRCAHKVTALDGYTALRALLPPPERRGLVLVDPPFEAPGELVRMTDGLAEALVRFPQGHYLLWYPIKDLKPVQRFQRVIGDLAAAARVETTLAIDLHLRPPRHPDLLNGCGVVLVNAPYDPQAALPPLMRRTAALLAGAGGPDTPQPHAQIVRLPAARR
jgi:23S rRNA (adenine2030-N6)-methyltransferase